MTQTRASEEMAHATRSRTSVGPKSPGRIGVGSRRGVGGGWFGGTSPGGGGVDPRAASGPVDDGRRDEVDHHGEHEEHEPAEQEVLEAELATGPEVDSDEL